MLALDGANLTVDHGRIHAVVGENGAGPLHPDEDLAGAVLPDAGSIALDDRTVVLDTPTAARAKGVGIVYQELSLFPNRSVLANLFVNAEPTRYGLLSRREMERRARFLLSTVSASRSISIDRDGFLLDRCAAACGDQPRAAGAAPTA